MARERRLRARVLAGASALAVAACALPAAAQGVDAEGVYRQEALAHARAVSEAWRHCDQAQFLHAR